LQIRVDRFDSGTRLQYNLFSTLYPKIISRGAREGMVMVGKNAVKQSHYRMKRKLR
jgi:hypothetical protein